MTRERRRLLRRGLYLLLGAVALYEIVRALGHPGDYRPFITFGEVTLGGEIPYLPEVESRYLKGHWATWPPSFVPIAVVLELLDRVSHPPAIMAWQAVNLAALGAVMAWTTRWLYDRRLSLGPGEGRVPLAALPVLAGLVVPMRIVLSNFEHEQANLLILGLAVGAFWLFRTGRRWSGGLSLGLATAFKGTPLLLVPYLAWRGRWRDLGAAAVGVAVAWGVLPALVVGPGEVGAWYDAWWATLPGLDLDVGPMNQSIQATTARLASGIDLWGPEGATAGIVTRSLGVLGGRAAAPWVAAIAAAFVAGSVAAFGRPLRQVSRRREALELGVVFTAMGLFSPLGWKWHYVGLVVLCAALAARTGAGRRLLAGGSGDGTDPAGAGGPGSEGGSAGATAVDDEGGPGSEGGPGDASAAGGIGPGGPWADRATVAVLLLALAAINFTATDLVGDRVADSLEMMGVLTWPALLLTVAALVHLYRERKAGG